MSLNFLIGCGELAALRGAFISAFRWLWSSGLASETRIGVVGASRGLMACWAALGGEGGEMRAPEVGLEIEITGADIVTLGGTVGATDDVSEVVRSWDEFLVDLGSVDLDGSSGLACGVSVSEIMGSNAVMELRKRRRASAAEGGLLCCLARSRLARCIVIATSFLPLGP